MSGNDKEEKRKSVKDLIHKFQQMPTIPIQTLTTPSAKTMVKPEAKTHAQSTEPTTDKEGTDFEKAHVSMQRKLRSDNADTIIISIGSGMNFEQNIPTFVRDLVKEHKVSIYNFDHGNPVEKNPIAYANNPYYKADYERFIKELNSRKHPNLKVEYATVFFPSTWSKDKSNAHILKRYIEILNAKKIENQSLRVIILDSCWHTLDKDTLEFCKGLIGQFKMGVDLEFIHTYFDHSPAVIYADFNRIPHVNPILRPEERLHSPDLPVDLPKQEQHKVGYDAEHDMYIFPRLQYLKYLFEPKPGKERKSKYKG